MGAAMVEVGLLGPSRQCPATLCQRLEAATTPATLTPLDHLRVPVAGALLGIILCSLTEGHTVSVVAKDLIRVN